MPEGGAFRWHINPGSAAGLPEHLAMIAEGSLTRVLDGEPRPPTAEGFSEMSDVQASGRAHGRLVMRWTDSK